MMRDAEPDQRVGASGDGAPGALTARPPSPGAPARAQAERQLSFMRIYDTKVVLNATVERTAYNQNARQRLYAL